MSSPDNAIVNVFRLTLTILSQSLCCRAISSKLEHSILGREKLIPSQEERRHEGIHKAQKVTGLLTKVKQQPMFPRGGFATSWAGCELHLESALVSGWGFLWHSCLWVTHIPESNTKHIRLSMAAINSLIHQTGLRWNPCFWYKVAALPGVNWHLFISP